ncbi:tRNA dihydrouridine synthase [Lecanicillium sp. MT-2017a]|nr:tRNA dihydrouridine synthase [Lecanicillium sp. MT-2017a]
MAADSEPTATGAAVSPPKKLQGRAFYESIGSPKYIVAPMVDQSEFAWRMLTRSFLSPSEKSKMLAYTPMFHARLFSQDDKYKRSHFQATRPGTKDLWLDGNPSIDRPLFVQFCANDPDMLLSAAQQVAPYCDAVDLNLGCPQGIARKGHYGAFLQEDQDLIFRLINKLHNELSTPVTAKIRILETKEKTLAYAQNVLKAGASILTVHGRLREQKGHLTGVANWKMLRFLRDNLPPETVLFANGNILQYENIDKCLEATGFDGVMSAEGNLSDPAIFAPAPPVGEEGKDYWRGKDGKGGWRVDAVMRRYLDLVYKYALDSEPPSRRPLFMPGDDTKWLEESEEQEAETDEPAKKKRKTEGGGGGGGKKEDTSPNLVAMQPHLFHLLRHFVTKHTDVRDMLARARKGGMEGFEKVLDAVERKVAEGILEYERTDGQSFQDVLDAMVPLETVSAEESSAETMRECKRPWWVAQPIIRPLPGEAMAKGAIKPSKKDLQAKKAAEEEKNGEADKAKTTAEAEVAGEKQATEEEIKSRDGLVSG